MYYVKRSKRKKKPTDCAKGRELKEKDTERRNKKKSQSTNWKKKYIEENIMRLIFNKVQAKI